MKRGDIILISFPFSDLTSTKVRPAVVLSPGDPGEEDVVVALITSNIQRPLKATDYLLEQTNPNFTSTGLKADSVFRMAKIHNLKKTLAKRRLGAVTLNLMIELEQKLKLALGL